MKKKKIIYVITKANWGGAQKYVFDLATTLPQDKYETLVVHGQGDILNKKLNASGIKTIEISDMGRDIGFLKEIISSVKLFKTFFDERPCTIHLNSSKAGGLGALMARLYQLSTINLKLRIIFTAHGWAFNELRFKKFRYKFLSWLTVFLSTKTIVLSNDNLKQGLKFPLLKRKFVLIKNGIRNIDFKEKRIAKEFIHEKTGAPVDEKWIVTISELHENKGLKYLIESLSKMRERPLLFIIGSGEQRKNLEDQISELKLQDNVYLMGFVENASSYLKAFDIFVLPSVKEGLPFVLLEAGLASLPIIGSNISGITDLIDENNGILFESKNSNELAGKIKWALENSQQMAELSHNFNKRVSKEFSFEQMFEKTIQLYQ